METTAIVIMADPVQGEEALGRVLNALVLANDLQQRKNAVKIYFQGTGTRWVNILEKSDHPGHGLYKSLTQCEMGASHACNAVFNANVITIPLLKEYDIPGLGSMTSLASAMEQGAQLVIF